MGLDITGLGSVADLINNVIDKIFPDKNEAEKAKIRVKELDQAGEFKDADQALEIAKGQMAINLEETKKGGILNQWRPALGWVCVSAYAFNYLFLPLGNFVADVMGVKADIVALSTGELTTLLFGMLGLGGFRTFEKLKGLTK